MTEETKKQEKKLTTKEQLQEIEKAIHVVKAKNNQTRLGLKTKRKEDLSALVSNRGRELKEIESRFEAKKKEHSESFAKAKEKLEAARDEAIAKVHEAFKEGLLAAKAEKEMNLQTIGEGKDKEVAPRVEKHKKQCDEVEDTFRTEMEAVDKKEEEELAPLKKELEKLQKEYEKELAKKKAKKTKKDEEPAQAEASA